MPLQRTQGRTTASTTLWGHLLRKTGSSQVPSSSLTSTSTLGTLGKHTPAIAPIDKAGASTRILLHDTQAHLEKFTDRVTQLTAGLDSAKRELVMAQKLYQDDHEQVIDKISGLCAFVAHICAVAPVDLTLVLLYSKSVSDGATEKHR